MYYLQYLDPELISPSFIHPGLTSRTRQQIYYYPRTNSPRLHCTSSHNVNDVNPQAILCTAYRNRRTCFVSPKIQPGFYFRHPVRAFDWPGTFHPSAHMQVQETKCDCRLLHVFFFFSLAYGFVCARGKPARLRVASLSPGVDWPCMSLAGRSTPSWMSKRRR